MTTIGHDKTGELVGFTAAHCGGPGAQVVAEGSEDRGPVGTAVATANDAHLDYSVTKSDPAKVTPVPDFAGFAINGIGPDLEWHQPACKLGAATGDFYEGAVSMTLVPSTTAVVPLAPSRFEVQRHRRHRYL